MMPFAGISWGRPLKCWSQQGGCIKTWQKLKTPNGSKQFILAMSLWWHSWHCCSSCDWWEAAERSFVPSKAKTVWSRASMVGALWVSGRWCCDFGNSYSQADKSVPDQHRTESCHSPQLIRKPADPAAWCAAEVTLGSSKPIQDLYRNVNIHMELCQEYTELMNIKVGVSQGNGMSHIWVNLMFVIVLLQAGGWPGGIQRPLPAKEERLKATDIHEIW